MPVSARWAERAERGARDKRKGNEGKREMERRREGGGEGRGGQEMTRGASAYRRRAKVQVAQLDLLLSARTDF